MEENQFVMRVQDASMEPRIPQGSFVVVEGQSDVKDGEIAVVHVLRNREWEPHPRVCRLYHNGEQVVLRPDNPALPLDFEPFTRIQIVGRVVEIRAKV